MKIKVKGIVMATNLVLYQVSQVALHMHVESIVADYKIDSRGKTIDPLGSMKPLVQDTPFLFKPRKIKYEATIVNTRYTRADEQVEELKKLVGVTVPVFGYIADDIYESSTHNNFCCACEGCSPECTIDFLQCVGMITSFDSSRVRDIRQPQKVKFELELHTFWRGIDNVQWDFGGSAGTYRPAPIVTDITANNINTYKSLIPDCGSLASCIKDCKAFLFRQVDNCLWRFSSTMFPLIVDQSATIANGDIINCNATEIAQSFTTTNNSDRVAITYDSTFWNAPPLSIYLVSAFGANTTVTIDVTDKPNGLLRDNRETVVDITATNTILTGLGLTELDDTTDVLVLGDFKLVGDNGRVIRNSAILRSGVLIEDAQPVVTFDGYFPAMLFSTPTAKIGVVNATIDHIHFYRKL
jgi:hypothetical protein